MYAGAIHPRKNLVNLLKGYSLFKKRQRSNMKLVLAGRMAWKNDAFLQLLASYKYKTDVVLLNYVDEQQLALLMGTAYALVYPSFFEGFGVPVLEAINCGVPPLTSAHSSMQEIGEEAALYFNPNDPADIGDKLMLIYKDETLRKNLIENGKSIRLKYSWQQTADRLWQCMMKAVQSSAL
jgi:glycosyltransferase involved in cell wall biosynthesis